MSSTPPIQFSGIASGLDTKAIIDALLAVESQGSKRLQTKLDRVKERQAALRDIRSSLVKLQQQAFSLTLTGKVNSRSTSIAAPTVLSATASAAAAKGVFTVNVSQLATSTRATSTAPIGSEIDAASALKDAGFASTPTSGTFTINGVQITIDVTTNSLNDVLTAINGAGAGVTASLTTDSGGRADNALQLVANAGGAIQLGAAGDTSNFLAVAKILGVQPTATQTGGTLNAGDETGGGGAGITAVDVAGVKRTDTYTFSYSAATNQLTLTRASDGASEAVAVVGLPAGVADTYDFASLGVKVSARALAANGEAADDIGSFLHAQTIVTTASNQSQGNLGTALSSMALSNARLDTALSATSGTFTINGKVISWKDTESINTIIGRINSSGAGVAASYDSIGDALTLTSTGTGSQLISLSDTTGNFLAATNLAAPGAQTAGQNAIYSIDTIGGGANLSSGSNTVSSVLSGVTLSFKAVGSTQVTISQETSSTISTAKAFVDQFNQAYSLMKDDLKYDPITKTAGVLFGDNTARTVQLRVRSLVAARMTGAAPGDKYQSLMDVGISFGKGSAAALELNEAKLTAAIQADADAVEALFKAFSNSATLVNGTGTLASISGAPFNLHQSGQYVITSTDNGDGTATLSSVFTPTGASAQSAVRGRIAAGGTNSSLINGVTLRSTNPVTAGTDTINVGLDQLGVAHQLNDYLTDLIGVGGVFRQRDLQTNDEIKSINDSIERFNERLASRRATLERQFAALESTLTTLQRQQSSLNAQLSQLQSGNR